MDNLDGYDSDGDFLFGGEEQINVLVNENGRTVIKLNCTKNEVFHY